MTMMSAPPYPTVPGIGGLGASPGGLASQLLGYGQGDMLLGGSLGTGGTGLGAIRGLGQSALTGLPYSSAALPGQVAGSGLGGMVPAGAGGQALEAANALRPLAGAAESASGLGGLGSRLVGLGEAATSNLPALRGAGLRGIASKAAIPLTLAWGADRLIDNLNPGGNNSNYEQALQGAAWGAGAGAIVGGPLGAAVGGVAGGAIGILANEFGGGGGDGDKQSDPVDIINKAVNAAGLDQSARTEIATTYTTLLALAEQYPDGSDERKAAEQQALEGAGQMVLQFLGQRDQASTQASNTLALQAQAGQIFEPLAADIEQSGQMYAQAMAGIRDQLPESYQAISDATVARELTSSQKLANAYRAQAAITPVANQLTQYQQDQQSYAAQMFSQAMAQQAAGGGTSLAGGSQADVLAALGG